MISSLLDKLTMAVKVRECHQVNEQCRILIWWCLILEN